MTTEKKRYVGIRCPLRLYNKMLDVKDNKGMNITDIVLRNLEVVFFFNRLFEGIMEKMTDKQKENILGYVMDKMDSFEVDEIYEFSEFYRKENQK